jgi:hypothetical protein
MGELEFDTPLNRLLCLGERFLERARSTRGHLFLPCPTKKSFRKNHNFLGHKVLTKR